MEVEAESKGTRSNPARGQRRAARWPSAAAPRPELMFSFGLCQVIQGAKEDEGSRPTRGSGRLRASGLLHELGSGVTISGRNFYRFGPGSAGGRSLTRPG